jgi:hypothetical protein
LGGFEFNQNQYDIFSFETNEPTKKKKKIWSKKKLTVCDAEANEQKKVNRAKANINQSQLFFKVKCTSDKQKPKFKTISISPIR